MSVQREKFLAIASAIRSFTGFTEPIKPNDFVPYIGFVYNKGVEVGRNQSGTSWYDTFWDSYQIKSDGKPRHHWNMAFYQVGWQEANYNPKHPITIIEFANSMYSSSEIVDTKIPLDFSKLRNQASDVFRSCLLMETIRTITVEETTTFSNWFTGDTALKNITFNGTIGQDISFADSKLLTNASVTSIINALMTLPSGVKRTVTFHSDVKNNIPDETKAYITNTKGWTLAL